jgi:hypothetical protein
VAEATPRPSITAEILKRAPRPPLIFACILLVVALFLGYVGGAVLDSSHFAHRASDALDDPAVQDEVSKAVSDSLTGAVPVPTQVGGEINGAVGTVITDPKFQKDFRVQVAKVHSELVSGDEDSATLQLKTIGPLVAKKLGLPAGVPVPAVGLQVKPPSGVLSIVTTLDSLSWLPGLLGLAALALLAWLLVRTFDRPDAVRGIAKTMLVSGLLMVVIYFVARQLITSAAGGTGAVGAIVGAYFGDFAIASLILAGAGVLGWIAASRVAAGPRARPAADAPKRRERAPGRAAGGLLKRREPATPAPEPAPPPEPVHIEPDGGSEDRTEVIPGQRARTDIPTIRVPSRDAPPRDAPPRDAPRPQTESTERATKTCPDCAETVLTAARVCKHCGYRFDPAP